MHSFNSRKKAPIIIRKDMIEVMQSGSIIYDLAASQGGNSELTKVNEIVETNGVKIMGETNILNKLPCLRQTFMQKISTTLLTIYMTKKKIVSN